MDKRTPPPRDLSTVELAVSHALEHAGAVGDLQTAAELEAILDSIRLRVGRFMPGGSWDTVPASGRMQ